jgi:hypothetical protein
MFRLLLTVAAAVFLAMLSLPGQSSATPIRSSAFSRAARRARCNAPAAVAGSHVRAGLACVDRRPGPDRTASVSCLSSRHQLTITLSESCRQCSFGEHRDTLESVHTRRDPSAPRAWHGGEPMEAE